MRLLTVLSSSLILGGLSLLAGCGDDGPSGPPEHGPLHACEGDYVCPAVAYTGYDGRTYFKVPFSTNLENPTWSVADPSLASLYKVNAPVGYEEFGASWVMLETFAPGTTKVIATEGGKTVEATVIIADYDPDVVAIGKQRYNYATGTGADRATCASCHQAVNGADHSSLEMAAFDDAEILKAIVEGVYSDGYVLDSGVEGQPHEWNLTAEEAPAIVPYLRSLAPTKFFKR